MTYHFAVASYPQHISKTDLEKPFFVNSEILGMHIRRKKCINYNKFEIATNCVNEIFNLDAYLFFLFPGAKWYYHIIYIVFTCFALFTDYKDDIFKVISNLNVQGYKSGGKIYKFGGKSLKKLTPWSSWS